jgi:translation initiation factor 3 subunit G
MESTRAQEENKLKWGDELDEEDEEYNEEDAENERTFEEIRTTEDGKKQKVLKRVRLVKKTKKVNKNADARRKTWKKFGVVEGKPPGPEPGITTVGDEVYLILNQKQLEMRAAKERAKKELAMLIPQGTFSQRRQAQPTPTEEAPPASPAKGDRSGVYQPPGSRGIKARPLVGPSSQEQEPETSTIRVTNLSEDTTDEDLENLFRPYGYISRIFLAKTPQGRSKGFAFINFRNRDDAARALERLNGTGFNHLILSIEWAKPSNK